MYELTEKEKLAYKYRADFAEWVVKTAQENNIPISDYQYSELLESADEVGVWSAFAEKGLISALSYEKYHRYTLPYLDAIRRIKRQNKHLTRRIGYLKHKAKLNERRI